MPTGGIMAPLTEATRRGAPRHSALAAVPGTESEASRPAWPAT